jgi:hypothetical protein
MADACEPSKKQGSSRATLIGTGFGCWGLLFFGLAEVFWASESGSTSNLVCGLLGVVFGGIGAGCVGTLVFTKRP